MAPAQTTGLLPPPRTRLSLLLPFLPLPGGAPSGPSAAGLQGDSDALRVRLCPRLQSSWVCIPGGNGCAPTPGLHLSHLLDSSKHRLTPPRPHGGGSSSEDPPPREGGAPAASSPRLGQPQSKRGGASRPGAQGCPLARVRACLSSWPQPMTALWAGVLPEMPGDEGVLGPSGLRWRQGWAPGLSSLQPTLPEARHPALGPD